MKKAIFLVITFLLSFHEFCLAQSTYVERKLRFGFNAGVSYSFLQVSKNEHSFLNDVHATNSAGLKLGVLLDYKLNEHFSISPKAELLLFNDNKVTIKQSNDSKLVYDIYPELIEFSVPVIYKFNGSKIRPYLLLGPCFRIPFSNKNNSLPQIAKSDIGINIGLGMDKKFNAFHFSPELVYSYGLLNIFNSNSIEKLNFHSVSLIFNFI